MANSLKFKSLTSLISQVIQFIGALVITPFVISKLGENYFSLWVLFVTLTSFEGLFQLGTSQALLRYIPFYLGKNELGKLGSLVRSHSLFYILICILLGLSLYLLKWPLFYYFDLPLEIKSSYEESLLWMYFGFCFSIVGKIFVTINNGYEKFVFYNVLSSLSLLIRLFLILIFIDKGFIIMTISYFISQVVLFVGLLFSYFRQDLHFFKGWNLKQDSKAFKIGLSFGLASLLMYVSDILRHQLDTLLILKNVDLASITHYKIGTTLLTSINGICMGLFGVILTRLSYHQGANQLDEFKGLSLRSYFFSSLFSTYFILGISLLSSSFLTLWLGSYDERSLQIIYILVVPQLLMLTQYPSINIMYSIGQQKVLGILTFVESIINVSVSLFLVMKLGIIGVTIGTAVGFVLSKGFVIPILLKKYCQLSFREQAYHVFPQFLVGILSYALLFFLFENFSFSTLLVDFIAKCFVVSLFFFMGLKAFYSLFPREEAEILTLAGVKRIFK